MYRDKSTVLRKIHVESIQCDTVLPSGNLYTSKLFQRIADDFNNSPDFRESVRMVQSGVDRDVYTVIYDYVTCGISSLSFNKEKKVLEVDLDILDTPTGRILNKLVEYKCGVKLIPHLIADSIDVDGIRIISNNSTDILFFEARALNPIGEYKK